MQICIPNAWNPRPYQRRLWDYFAKGGRRAVAVWHRRCGKDSLALNLEASKALTERVGVYWHMLPLNTQARKVIWDGVDRYGRRMIDQAFPKELRQSTNDQEMKIVFKNGSVWQCVGSDNYDALVGSNPVGVVFSEYSVTPKAATAWDYIRPILAENGGWALFIYTPRGHNHGYALYNQAKAAGWFTELLTVDDTKAIPAEAVEEERRAGMSEAMIQQEFFCSFEAVNDEELKLISFDLIAPSLDREIAEKPDMPLVIGVDPARFGDDKTAIARRRGRSVFRLERFAKKSVTEIANIVASIIRLEKPARVFIDAGGLGAGVEDILRDRGFGSVVRGVNFGERAENPERFVNRRAEMWFRVKEWLQSSAPVSVVNACDIREDLTAPMIMYDQLGRLGLEPKAEIKKRILRSTDVGDAVALTFAEQVHLDRFALDEQVDDTVYC